MPRGVVGGKLRLNAARLAGLGWRGRAQGEGAMKKIAVLGSGQVGETLSNGFLKHG
jgi:hypothetical protein